MNQDNFRKLISGQKTGLGAGLLRLLLGVAAKGYSIVIRLRNFLYSRGWLKTHRANAPVISIGNITTGGTGKTPLVIWICRFLQNKNVSCAILTRGYKARGMSDEGRATRDEPAILIESCPEAKVIVNPDRVAGAAEAVNKFGAKTLVMDRLREDAASRAAARVSHCTEASECCCYYPVRPNHRGQIDPD
ncbi:MAG: tetraacyldisaccharide 4'-kinase [Planctomycetota bacterium]|jgi:tetraacyldisaccharide 4'-kinase